MTYLGVNLTDYQQSLYAENYKTLLRETEVYYEVYYIFESEDAILLRCHLFPDWFIASVQSQSTYQQAILKYKSRHWF